MRTLRQLSYAGTTTLLTSVGVLFGCSGDLSDPQPDMGCNDPNDIDCDGIPNLEDTDADGDGVPASMDPDDMDPNNPYPQPTGSGGSVSGTGGGGPGTGGGEPGTGGGSVKTCVPGVPATSQVPRIKNRVYDNIVNDVLGLESLSDGRLPSDILLDDSTGAMDSYMWNAYQSAADAVATDVMADPALKANFMSCDPAAVATCYEDTITSIGRKLFRRPMTQDQIDSFMRLTAVTPQGTPEEISKAILYTFLVSPSFIMVTEFNNEPAPTGGFQLSSHEVAMRLSLAIWGSVPDQTLNDAADAGLLTTKEQIMEQAARMLQDKEKAGSQVAAAHRAYLNVSDNTHWWQNIPDSTKYPEYVEGSIPAMQQELNAFFQDVAFSNGTFEDLFLSNVGYVNAQTAAIYGLDPANYGMDLTRVDFPPGERPGFMTRAGFLVSKAHTQSTSPILRGAFVTIDILGLDPGPPDPSALMTALPEGDYSSQREVTESLTSFPSCKKCHEKYVNPPGFVLERFNAAGVLQTTDTSWLPDEPSPLGGAIDASATVTFSADNVKPVETPQQLMEEIVGETEPRRIYAERLVSFVMGRLANQNDACIVNDLAAKLAAGDGYTILNLFTDITQADSFRQRTVGN